MSLLARAGAILAVVTIGGSQVFFGLIAGNREHFPGTRAFLAWTLVWAQILPALLLLGADLLIERLAGPEGLARRAWRAALYAVLAASFLRQAQVQYPGLLFATIPVWAAVAAYLAVPAGIGILAARHARAADRYAAALGVLALILTFDFVRRVWPATPGAEVRETAAATGRPVVILLFDELGLDVLLRDGAIDATTFPHFAALASESAWFPDATTHYGNTGPSVRSMLTGRVDGDDRGPLLFERLRDTHRLRSLVAWPGLSTWVKSRAGPGDRCISRTDADALKLGPLETAQFLTIALRESSFARDGITLGLQGRNFATPDLWDLWTSRDVLGVEIESFLVGLTKANAPGRIFYWHCSLPHFPFQYDAQGRRHGREDVTFRMKEDPRPVLENYREQVRRVDGVVGQVIDRLKAEGIYDETLLVLTSDHGLRTFGMLEPEGYPEVRSGLEARVPFFIRGPGVKPGVYAADYQHVDFTPTLLDVLGKAVDPGAFEGSTVFAPRGETREKAYVAYGSPNSRYVLDRAAGVWRRRSKD